MDLRVSIASISGDLVDIDPSVATVSASCARSYRLRRLFSRDLNNDANFDLMTFVAVMSAPPTNASSSVRSAL
nr:hypothetical protein [Bradyrhizobium ivorense]